MLISHKNKFVFIAINKTATTSIHDALECVSEIKSVGDSQSPFYFHANAKKIKSKFKENNWDWNSYFKFSFVRNPVGSYGIRIFLSSKNGKEMEYNKTQGQTHSRCL